MTEFSKERLSGGVRIYRKANYLPAVCTSRVASGASVRGILFLSAQYSDFQTVGNQIRHHGRTPGNSFLRR